jgi:hypothetical protein
MDIPSHLLEIISTKLHGVTEEGNIKIYHCENRVQEVPQLVEPLRHEP